MDNPRPTIDWLYRGVRALGPLRLTLLGGVLAALVLIPEPGTRAAFSGWPLVTTVLIPVLTPLLFMVLLLDALMARVFLADAGVDRAYRDRLKIIVRVDLLAALALLLRWLPYYAALRV